MGRQTRVRGLREGEAAASRGRRAEGLLPATRAAGQGLGASPFSGCGGTLAGKVGGLGRRQSREFPSPLHLDLVGVTEETTSVPEPSVLREGPRACLASQPARGPGEAQSPCLSQSSPGGRSGQTPGP